ncbi:deoxyribonuclease gamma [Callorhinchus milii]|uniref:Deoxyribonuclease n=1 Tax=Callorhinchus milii TaxID=7868 RepID=V9KNG2_CALMI|nr:deoxyribonuclease gamma [Callorhinchus milii]|eukprot:gi/632983817/ref/XP_007908834.1/ PREDICTED: deoxyribonuclease gamma isoform X1 [Callorhinchus milii]
MGTALFLHGILFLASLNGIQPLKICSFNVRTFGEAKVANQEVLNLLVRIISRCDLMLIMEIKDSSNRSFPVLMGSLNRSPLNYRNSFSYIISGRLGRKTYKEQYAFIYRNNLLSVKKSYQYPDNQEGDEDAFAREPFVVWFSSIRTNPRDFVIIPQHTSPESSVREIDKLYDVYMAMKCRWRAKNFIIMGDFNAGCDYVRKKHWANIRLRNDSNFNWLIGDNNDTTVKERTNCAYDRIVMRGERLIQSIVPNSVNIFNFKEAYKMTENEAWAVSDHFPVEVELQEDQSFSSRLFSLRR